MENYFGRVRQLSSDTSGSRPGNKIGKATSKCDCEGPLGKAAYKGHYDLRKQLGIATWDEQLGRARRRGSDASGLPLGNEIGNATSKCDWEGPLGKAA